MPDLSSLSQIEIAIALAVFAVICVSGLFTYSLIRVCRVPLVPMGVATDEKRDVQVSGVTYNSIYHSRKRRCPSCGGQVSHSSTLEPDSWFRCVDRCGWRGVMQTYEERPVFSSFDGH